MSLKQKLNDLLKGKITEEEVLASLRDAGTSPPGRPELSAEERRQCKVDLDAAHTAWQRGDEANRKELAAAEERLRLAQAERDRLLGTMSSDAYVRKRDAIFTKCWDGRPALADKLLAQLDAELAGQSIQRYFLPSNEDPGRHVFASDQGAGAVVDERAAQAVVDMARVVSNARSVQARARALHEFKDRLRDVVARAEVADASELQAWFNAEYAALPAIENVTAELARDIRGRAFVKEAAKAHRSTSPLPPAA
jgi:hypothetical protein